MKHKLKKFLPGNQGTIIFFRRKKDEKTAVCKPESRCSRSGIIIFITAAQTQRCFHALHVSVIVMSKNLCYNKIR